MRDMGRASPEALEVVRNFLGANGKFVRPSLLLFGFEAHGGEISPTIIKLAISLELLHIYLLVHDDIIDASDMRRGVPALHKSFEAYHEAHKLRGQSVGFGISMAILIGDLLCAEAERPWTEAAATGVASSEARLVFDELKQEVGWGQYRDTALTVEREPVPLDDILAIMSEKSGRYSIYRPIQIGALLAGKTIEDSGWLETFGINLGIVFQGVDDILGVFGDSEVVGKSVDSDLRERKFTLLTHFAFASASPTDRKHIETFFGYSKEDSANLMPALEEVRTLFEKYEVAKKTRAVIQAHYDKAVAAISASGLSEERQTELHAFAEFILNRKK